MKLAVALMLPLAAMATYLILRALWNEIDPDRDGHRETEATHRAIAIRVVLFVMALCGLVMLNLGGVEWIRPWGPRLVVVLFGSVFVAVGNLLPQTRPNLALGIRTSRTLSDRALWIRLHRVCGYLSVALGVVIVAAGLLLSGPAIGPAIGAAALGCVATLLITYGGRTVRTAGEWALRLLLALAFVVAGVDKFTGPMWVRVFSDIGLGQWFRYFTGVVELLGGCLLLLPRATVVAVPLLVCTMAGAILVHLTVVGIGAATVAVSVLIVALVMLWLLHRRAIA